MFEKTLTDVVKGIRSSKRDTALYISQCISEIKNEINSSDMYVKANALQKLTFLQMMGYSMGYASFATIEVMSSTRFAHKRIGYLAASQGYKQDTEVILLATNLLKKELRAAVGGGMHGVYEVGLAINCIANIVTEDLARDLLPELTNLTTHPQPYLRKKAILCLFKLFIKYPQGLRLTFEKIQKCLEDSNSSVVSCAVNVITELSDKNPKNYLHLAPHLFRLLTESSNNWMLIKVVKLLGSLVPEEPRLARKLLEPLSEIVKSTQAKSLLYEAVRTITLCLPYVRKADGTMPPIVPDIVDLCARTLRDFVEQADQNLKYLGLVGFGSLMQSHPRILSAPNYRPLILACLSDQDVTIRNRALDLMPGIVSRKNLMELITQLLEHVELATGLYKTNLVSKIIAICSADKYSLIQDFSWYLDVLFQLGHMRGLEGLGAVIRAQIRDVALRVLPVRPYAVRRSMEILLEGEGDVVENFYGDNGRGKQLMNQLLPALSWILGEYSHLIRKAMSIDPEEGDKIFSLNEESTGTYHALIQCLLAPLKCEKIPALTRASFVHSAFKVFAAASSDTETNDAELAAIISTFQSTLTVHIQSTDAEVTERSLTALSLIYALGLNNATKVDNKFEMLPKGDLLGLIAPVKSITTDNELVAETLVNHSSTRVREVSDLLNFLLKPSPMKPSGSKTQRKKRSSPVGVQIDLDGPINLATFNDLLNAENATLSSRQSTLESLSFSQQHVTKPSHSSSLTPVTTNSMLPHQLESGSSTQANLKSTKPTGSRQRQGDPFYLTSQTKNTTDDEPLQSKNRFGTIQLVDSDEESANNIKSKKKKKKSKAGKRDNDTDTGNVSVMKNSFGEMTFYDSDDDEVERPKSTIIGKRRPGREFEGLSKIDLTTPLREDEVMPVRQHRVVPDRPRPIADSGQVKKKEKKAKKERKVHSSTKNKSPEIGDLLDLGNDISSEGVIDISTGQHETESVLPPNNLINLAFDDLVGLTSIPSITPQTPDVFAVQIMNDPVNTIKEKSKRPWLKVKIKSNDLPWSQLDVKFQPFRSKQNASVAASLIVHVKNRSPRHVINLSLAIKDNETIHFGTIAPDEAAESTKLGPFPYSGNDVSQELKGTLQSEGHSCSIKFCFPVTFQFKPEENLTLEQVAQELAGTGWHSQSVKVDLVYVKEPIEVKAILMNFMRVAEVRGGGMDANAGTYAAKSMGNHHVRILVKLKENVAKVDIKSTSLSLCKEIVSDMKRIIL